MIDGHDRFVTWLAALEARHLADLRVPEVTRALSALSSAYVERRQPRAAGAGQRVRGSLDTAGKRAAFALFYAPLHFLTVSNVVRALGATVRLPPAIVDLGCGNGILGVRAAIGSPKSEITFVDESYRAVASAEATWKASRT